MSKGFSVVFVVLSVVWLIGQLTFLRPPAERVVETGRGKGSVNTLGALGASSSATRHCWFFRGEFSASWRPVQGRCVWPRELRR